MAANFRDFIITLRRTLQRNKITEEKKISSELCTNWSSIMESTKYGFPSRRSTSIKKKERCFLTFQFNRNSRNRIEIPGDFMPIASKLWEVINHQSYDDRIWFDAFDLWIWLTIFYFCHNSFHALFVVVGRGKSIMALRSTG